MSRVRYIIRCHQHLSDYDSLSFLSRLREVDDIKIEINNWPDVTFTSDVNYQKMKEFLDSEKSVVFSWNAITPVKELFREITDSIKRKILYRTKKG